MKYAALTLASIGMLVSVVCLIQIILTLKHRSSPAISTGLLISFILGQVFFNAGLMFYLGYSLAKFNEYETKFSQYDAILRTVLEALGL